MSTAENKTKYTSSLIILTSLFFMWGFITCMNDILIPYLKGIFHLDHFQAMFVQFAFFAAYFVGSVIYFIISSTTGDPINKIGYKNGIIIGLLVSAAGTGLFYPAAELVSYSLFLIALFVLGLGLTLLQITANPYVSILGPEKTAAGRLNLSQGFNSLGTTIAPISGGYLIFKFFAGSEVTGADSVKIPYLFFSGLFLLLALFIKFTNLPVFTNNDKIEKGAGALKFSHLNFGILAIFMYVGSEVCIGSILISFLGLPEIAGLKPAEASIYVAFYWAGLMIGRFIGAISLSNINSVNKNIIIILIPVLAFSIIWYLKGFDIAKIYGIFLALNYTAFLLGKSLASRTLCVFALCAVCLLVISFFTMGSIAMWTVISVGLFNSIMWSNIFTLSINGLGKSTSQGSSLLVMAILGGALLPVLQGYVADHIGIQKSFIIPVLAYLYIAFYGLIGFKNLKTIEINQQ